MTVTRLLCSLFFALSPVVASGQLTAPPAVLPEVLRTHVRSERFQIVTSVRGLPLGVRGQLEMLFGTYSLDIAEPGAPFRSGRASGDAALPSRRLITAGCSYDHCLVYYERGGTGRDWRVVLFRWTPQSTQLESGGIAPGGLDTLEGVRAVVLSGKVQDTGGVW